MDNSLNDELVEITPAQFFDAKKDRCLFAIPLPKNPLEAESGGLALVTSSKEKIAFTDNNLFKMGYSTLRYPSLKPRWSQTSVKRFMAGENVASLSDAYIAILKQLELYIELESYEFLEILTLWVIGTYMHRSFPAFPYIHLNGHAGSGKTKTLMLVSLLAFNGKMSTETTPAALVRMTHDNSATICMDEIEKLQHAKDEMSQTVLSILNIGYKKGGLITKMEPGKWGKGWDYKEFDPYCAKILAGIRGLDPTLASRCIPMLLVKSANTEIVNQEIDIEAQIWGNLRDEIYEGVISGGWKSILAYSQELKDEEIQGRDWETWKPLLAVAKHIDEKNPGLFDRVRQFALEICRQKKSALIEESFAGKLLTVLHVYFLRGKYPQKFVSLKELLDHLRAFHPEMVNDFKSGSLNPWVTTKWLAGELRKTGLVTGPAEQRKIGDDNLRGYDIDYSKIKMRMRVHGLNPDDNA